MRVGSGASALRFFLFVHVWEAVYAHDVRGSAVAVIALDARRVDLSGWKRLPTV